MVEKSSEPRLLIQGYPPEAGLYASILESTGLHGCESGEAYGFRYPKDGDGAGLNLMWRSAETLLVNTEAGVTLADLFNVWRAPPFGVRDGLLSILGVAFLLSVSSKVAIYLDEVFRPQLDSFVVDRLLQDATAIRIRWVELTDLDSNLISDLARKLSRTSEPVAPTPLDVAKAIVRSVRSLPGWTLRTGTLSKNAESLRNLGRNSHDPNRLLFEDLPKAIGHEAGRRGNPLSSAIDLAGKELEAAYPAMLRGLLATLFSELRVKDVSAGDYGDLRHRAATVRGISGNFRLAAVATRLPSFEGSLEEIEGLASLAANKPPRDWVDRDVDAARMELAALAQQFCRAEGFNHLKGRTDGRVTFAVYASDPDFPSPASPEVELDSEERRQAKALAKKLDAVLVREQVSRQVAIGALAKVGLSLNDGKSLKHTAGADG